MSTGNPFFSIVVPTYNRENLIGTSLESIISQTFNDYEVIIVDDGGGDNTNAVVAGYANKKFHYFKKTNGERGAARNFGIKRARGQYITFLDSDDIFYPFHLQEAYNFFTANPSTQCYAQAYEIKEAKSRKVLIPAKKVKCTTVNKELIQGNFLSCFGVFLKRENLSIVHFEEERRFSGTEDWLLWLQMAARFPFYYNNKVTGAMLEHESRSVLSFNEESLAFRTEFLKRKLEEDSEFVNQFGQKVINKIYTHMLTYTSVHLAMSRKKRRAMHYWFKAIKLNVSELMTRRTLAIAKKILFA